MLKKQYHILCKETDLSAQSSRVPTDIFHYVQLHSIRFSNPIIPAQNLSHCSNLICNGSPWIIMEIFANFPNLLRQQLKSTHRCKDTKSRELLLYMLPIKTALEMIMWKEIKWICGFTNAQGGKIYIGKNGDGMIIGVANQDKTDLASRILDIIGEKPSLS